MFVQHRCANIDIEEFKDFAPWKRCLEKPNVDHFALMAGKARKVKFS